MLLLLLMASGHDPPSVKQTHDVGADYTHMHAHAVRNWTYHSNRKLLCRSQKHRLVGPCCYFKAGMSNSFYIMDHIQPSLSLEKGSPPNYTFSSRDIWIWEKRCKKSISYPTHERNAAVVNQRLTTGTFMLLNCSSNNTNNHDRGFYCCEKL